MRNDRRLVQKTTRDRCASILVAIDAGHLLDVVDGVEVPVFGPICDNCRRYVRRDVERPLQVPAAVTPKNATRDITASTARIIVGMIARACASRPMSPSVSQ